jgi:hypothetical protein
MNLKMLIKQVKGYKLPGIDKIPAEIIQAGSRTVHSQIHKLCKFQACTAVSLCLFFCDMWYWI